MTFLDIVMPCVGRTHDAGKGRRVDIRSSASRLTEPVGLPEGAGASPLLETYATAPVQRVGVLVEIPRTPARDECRGGAGSGEHRRQSDGACGHRRPPAVSRCVRPHTQVRRGDRPRRLQPNPRRVGPPQPSWNRRKAFVDRGGLPIGSCGLRRQSSPLRAGGEHVSRRLGRQRTPDRAPRPLSGPARLRVIQRRRDRLRPQPIRRAVRRRTDTRAPVPAATCRPFAVQDCVRKGQARLRGGALRSSSTPAPRS